MRIVQLTQECQKYVEQHSSEIGKKFKYCVQILSEQKVVHTKLVKKLIKTELYELRISSANEHKIILFTTDHKNLVEAKKIILLNGFIKKSTKDYIKAIDQAEKLISLYKISRDEKTD